MKKYLFGILVSSLVLFGCQRADLTTIDVHTITDLVTLQEVIAQVSNKMNKGTIDMITAQNLVDQLQQKYVDLTANAQTPIENEFNALQKIFDQQAIKSYTLPLWAKRLGMREPKGMVLNESLSKKNSTGYNGVVLVYQGVYESALQQAKLIAKKANLYVSKEFEKGQLIAKIGNIHYISGLDLGNLTKGIVYVNHDLTDTNIDYMLSVSVDKNGTLTLEATNYTNN